MAIQDWDIIEWTGVIIAVILFIGGIITFFYAIIFYPKTHKHRKHPIIEAGVIAIVGVLAAATPFVIKHFFIG